MKAIDVALRKLSKLYEFNRRLRGYSLPPEVCAGEKPAPAAGTGCAPPRPAEPDREGGQA